MSRYLVRLPNRPAYTRKDVEKVSREIRTMLGSREKASHFRVSDAALEFNMFAMSDQEFDRNKEILQKSFSRILTLKRIDNVPEMVGKEEALRQGVEYFNQERFWEAHEILEQAWNQSTGPERDAIQGLILTAAAFVHYQKYEDDICLSILVRAWNKLGNSKPISGTDIEKVKGNIRDILDSKTIKLFRIS
ncbi:MAG TPA: DUF309 domain-containing protein [Candidatus Bathyarchaeia archaeon]|nr:DUF309 domain-containing protein [Candidatus Bathyarchaeia archaeon]